MATKKKRTTKRKIKRKRPTPAKVSEGVTPSAPADRNVTPYPRAGDNPELAALLNETLEAGGPAGGTDAEAKRGPGRPPGTGKHQRAAAAMTAQEVAGLDESVVVDMWKLPFELWATANKLQSLKLSDAEAVALARPSLVLLAHYAPGRLSPVQLAWYQLSGTLATVTLSRLLVLRQVSLARADRPTDASANTVGPTREARPDRPPKWEPKHV